METKQQHGVYVFSADGEPLGEIVNTVMNVEPAVKTERVSFNSEMEFNAVADNRLARMMGYRSLKQMIGAARHKQLFKVVKSIRKARKYAKLSGCHFETKRVGAQMAIIKFADKFVTKFV